MHDFLNKRIEVSRAITPTGANGPVVFTGTGDKFIVSPANPITILRYGIIWTVAKDATAFVLSLDKRPTAGSDTNRVEMATLSDAAARAGGVVVEKELLGPNPNSSTGADGSLVNVARGAPVDINPGEEAVFEVTDASVAGSGYIFVEYVEYDEAGSRAALVVSV